MTTSLFKGPGARVSLWYHVAVTSFFVGGFLFGVDLILAFKKAKPLLVSQFSVSSSAFFFLGSVAFVVDAFPHAVKDKLQSAPSNTYLWGSVLFLVGSAFWIVGSSLLFSKTATEMLIDVFNFLAGLMFLFGSTFFLLLGYFEMHEFNRGPDMDLPAVRRRCEKLGIDPEPSNNPHFITTSWSESRDDVA